MLDTYPMVADARSLLLERFRWIDGHADVWRVFRHSDAFAGMIVALADPFRDAGLTAVAGIESRGFLLGGAVAVELGVGFVAVRKAGSLFPGQKVRRRAERDYRGNRAELLLQRDSVGLGDRVLLVDDWIETGSQALAVQELIRACEATLVGVSVLVDGMSDHPRARLPTVRSVIRFDELPEEQGLPVGDSQAGGGDSCTKIV